MKQIDGIELRDDLAAGYKAAAERAGKPVSFETAQATAHGDLLLVDAVTAAHPPKPALAKPERPKRSEKIEALTHEMHDKGYRLVQRTAKAERPRQSTIRGVDAERHLAAMTRLSTLLEVDWKAHKHGAPIDELPFKYPAFAKDYMTEHGDMTAGRREYRFLTEVDRQRRFARFLHNLCDRSTGVLGPWWVK